MTHIFDVSQERSGDVIFIRKALLFNVDWILTLYTIYG